jgi:hypothetical protein
MLKNVFTKVNEIAFQTHCHTFANCPEKRLNGNKVGGAFFINLKIKTF